LTSQPIDSGPLAFQLNSSGLSKTGNCQVLWPVNNEYNPLNDVPAIPVQSKQVSGTVPPTLSPASPIQPKSKKKSLLSSAKIRLSVAALESLPAQVEMPVLQHQGHSAGSTSKIVSSVVETPRQNPCKPTLILCVSHMAH
jgi:hypothetical protein